MAEQRSSRIRLKYGPLEVEIEGDPQMVSEEFRRLREEGIGKLAEALAYPSEEETLGREEEHLGEEEAPPKTKPPVAIAETLYDLAVKDVAKTEPEWVTVYAYWLSEVENKRTFSWADLWTKYEEAGRDTKSRKGGLSRTIGRAIKKGHVTKIKENTYSLLPAGKTAAEEVIRGAKSTRGVLTGKSKGPA